MIHHIAQSPELLAYIEAHSPLESDVLVRLRERTAELAEHPMQVSPAQGRLLHFLTTLVGAQKVLEVGVFTGYSSISMATALPETGVLTALDCSVEWTAIAHEFWVAAGVDQLIDLRLGDARDSLDDLLNTPGELNSYDLVFLDADKVNYLAYFEGVLSLLRPGGLIVVDNTLWSGLVLDDNSTDPDTEALQEFNRIVATDDRVDSLLLPLVDGTTLLRKRVQERVRLKLV